ncbi:glycosyltransferase family 39 protein [Nakamurella sp. A5-74]|uniref:Glycosyltransferase family 39 protein n=1 Tax=Nakamurella sp. A5-74 TaxID=3158264 RepID=A0AAU8DUI8_9ACTN
MTSTGGVGSGGGSTVEPSAEVEPGAVSDGGNDCELTTQPLHAVARTSTSPRAPRTILLTILIAAAVVRIPGILWGLPALLHPDERVVVVDAIGMITRHTFEPSIFYRPDHLEIKLDSLVFRLYGFFAGGRADVMFRQDGTVFYALARTVTVLFSLGAVALAHLVGSRFGRWTGPIAAFLFAFYPPFVANSSLATPDIWLTCLLTAVVWSCLRYLERPSWRSLTVGCVLTALAVATKYPGALGALPIVAVIVAVLVRSGDRARAVRHLVTAPFAFVLALLVISPTLVTNFAAVRAQLVGQSGSGHLGASGLTYPGRAWYYVEYLGGWLGIVLIAATLFGLYLTVKARAAQAIPLFVGVPFWLGVSALGLQWFRWSLPMAITVLLLAAIGVSTALDRLMAFRSSGRPHVRSLATIGTAAIVLSGVSQLCGTAVTATIFATADTRIVALPWLTAHGIVRENSVYDGYNPFRNAGIGRLPAQLEIRDGALVPLDPERKYVVISSYLYDRVYGDPDPQLEPYYRAVEKLPLVAEWVPAGGSDFQGLAPLAPWRSIQLIARFTAGAMTGPTIKVYALPTLPAG